MYLNFNFMVYTFRFYLKNIFLLFLFCISAYVCLFICIAAKLPYFLASFLLMLLNCLQLFSEYLSPNANFMRHSQASFA